MSSPVCRHCLSGRFSSHATVANTGVRRFKRCYKSRRMTIQPKCCLSFDRRFVGASMSTDSAALQLDDLDVCFGEMACVSRCRPTLAP